MLAVAHWIWRADGLIHLYTRDGHDLPRGPLGLLLYVPVAILFWAVPPRGRLAYLTFTSYLLMLVTLGPAYALTLLLLGLIGYGMTRWCARSGRLGWGIALWSSPYAALLICPQPPFLPPIRSETLQEPLYFYLHWAGIGYVFLKTVHVIVDVAKQRMPAPPFQEFLAYLLFAPTLRMGPIYRYPDFARQLESVAQVRGQSSVVSRETNPAVSPHDGVPTTVNSQQTTDNEQRTTDESTHRDLGAAAIRIVFGLVRLGVMSAMLKNCPIDKLFGAPGSLPAYRFLACLYATPSSIYLWISGYVDISIGVGLIMGFRVPENFNYPWKATSIADFWRRWHLTLGSWLREYVYIPLGGNRQHVFFNYFVTFLLCGVWHGLYLSYVLWGISQGVGLAVNRSWGLYWKRVRESNSPLYHRLERMRLVNSPINAALGWLLTFHYQILTIVLFMVEDHTVRPVFTRLLGVLTGHR